MSGVIDQIRKISDEARSANEQEARRSYPRLLEQVKEAAKAGKNSCKFSRNLLYEETLNAFQDEGFKVCFDGHEKSISYDYFIQPNPRKMEWTVEW